MTRLFATVCLAACLCSCQKTMLDDDDAGGSPPAASLPVGLGAGTEQEPFTVADVQSGIAAEAGGSVWVIGYVVGATYRTLSAAEFSPALSYTSNVLLSYDSLCVDVERCIPVELSSQKWQTQFSLPSHPEGFRQCVMLQGIPSRYYKSSGLRKVCAGRWLYGFDIARISREPQEWDHDTISSAKPPRR